MTGINYHPLSPEPFPPRNQCLLSVIKVNSTFWPQKSQLLKICLQTGQTKPRLLPAGWCSTEGSRPGGTCAMKALWHRAHLPWPWLFGLSHLASLLPWGWETDSILHPCWRWCRVSCGCYHNSTVHNPLLFHVTLAAQNCACLFSPDNSCYWILATGLLFTLAKRG